VLVEADPCREGEIRAHADEHWAPVLVVQIEVILIDPTLLTLVQDRFLQSEIAESALL
jgi:hypothetical protein